MSRLCLLLRELLQLAWPRSVAVPSCRITAMNASGSDTRRLWAASSSPLGFAARASRVLARLPASSRVVVPAWQWGPGGAVVARRRWVRGKVVCAVLSRPQLLLAHVMRVWFSGVDSSSRLLNSTTCPCSGQLATGDVEGVRVVTARSPPQRTGHKADEE